MARRHAPPYGWGPPAFPRHRAGSSAGRFMWPALVLGAFAALAAFVAASDGRPGMSDRGWLIVLLAAVVAGVLHAHRGQGVRHLVWTLAEYTVVAALVLLLAGLSPADPTPTRRQARHRDRDRPAVARVIEAPGNALDWIANRWRAATEAAEDQADREAGSAPPPTTRPRR